MDSLITDEPRSLSAAAQQGDAQSTAELFAWTYHELRRLARWLLRGERDDHTLQTTALVNEAYVRLCGAEQFVWQSREQFLSVVAHKMRCVLVDHARRVHAQRRGGNAVKLSLAELSEQPLPLDGRLVALDDALSALGQLHERAARLVELRYFIGLTEAEAAIVLGISVTTVKRDWALARAWLLRELSDD